MIRRFRLRKARDVREGDSVKFCKMVGDVFRVLHQAQGRVEKGRWLIRLNDGALVEVQSRWLRVER